MHGGRETGGEEFPYADVPQPMKMGAKAVRDADEGPHPEGQGGEACSAGEPVPRAGDQDVRGRQERFKNSLHVWRAGTVRDVVSFPYCYHFFDRVGKPRVVHKKYDVPRLPAILELCIQAGVDVERYPTKRRTKPVYSIEGRIAAITPLR